MMNEERKEKVSSSTSDFRLLMELRRLLNSPCRDEAPASKLPRHVGSMRNNAYTSLVVGLLRIFVCVWFFQRTSPSAYYSV